MIFHALKPRPTRFTRNEDGYITIEAVIVLPIMLWLFGVGWVYFDAFRQQSVNQKANYVISDMISRETDPVNETYIANTYNLLTQLTHSTSSETDFRATVVQYDLDTSRWDLVWSDAYGARSALVDADIPGYEDRLPVGMDNEQLILIETWEDYEPAFDVGLGAFEIMTYSFTAPRYTPQIVWGEATGSSGGGNSGSSGSTGGSGGSSGSTGGSGSGSGSSGSSGGSSGSGGSGSGSGGSGWGSGGSGWGSGGSGWGSGGSGWGSGGSGWGSGGSGWGSGGSGWGSGGSGWGSGGSGWGSGGSGWGSGGSGWGSGGSGWGGGYW